MTSSSSLPLSRRHILAGTAASVAAAMAGPSGFAADAPALAAIASLKLGVASYSFRKLTIEQAVKGMARVGVKYASIKDAHLKLNATTAERKAAVAKFKAAGVTPLSAGVITIPNDAAAARNAFEYGRDCGLTALVVSPDAAILPTLEKLVQEFDIRIAIHNHGPEDTHWPTPNSVIDSVKNMDLRIGICIDVGHTARAKVNPAQAILDFKDRLFDLHLKDVSGLDTRGASGEVEVGRGVLDIKAILAALVKIEYKHHIGLEHEKDADDPIPGVAESIGYTRAILATLA